MPPKAALQELRRQKAADEAAALCQQAEERPITPPANRPRHCTGCEAKEPENNRVPEPCEHYTCKPCKLINYLLKHGREFAAEWYESSIEQRSVMVLTRQATCKHGCQTSYIPTISPDRTPPSTPEIEKCRKEFTLSRKVVSAAGGRMQGNYTVYKPVPVLQAAAQAGEMPAICQRNTLYAIEHDLVVREGWGNVILVSIRGREATEGVYLYIWANIQDDVQSLIQCIQKVKYGSLWPGGLPADYNFFRKEEGEFGSIRSNDKVGDHLEHEGKLVMKCAILS